MAKKKRDSAPEPQPEEPAVKEVMLEVTDEQLTVQAVAEANIEYESAKADRETMKAGYKRSVEREKQALAVLLSTIHEHTTAYPLFDRPRPAVRTPHPETLPSPAAPEPSQAVGHAGDDESWRNLSLTAFGLPESLLDKLNGADLFTVGQYAEWCRTPGNDLGNLKGIGPAAQGKIADAEMRFWERWRAGEFVMPAAVIPADPPDVAGPPDDFDEDDDDDDDLGPAEPDEYADDEAEPDYAEPDADDEGE